MSDIEFLSGSRRSFASKNIQLLDRIDPTEVTLIHTTSVEAVLMALESGKLVREGFSNKATFEYTNGATQDYLFATPNLQYFADFFREMHDDWSSEVNSWEGVIKEAKLCGRSIAFRHYISSKFGYQIGSHQDFLHNFDCWKKEGDIVDEGEDFDQFWELMKGNGYTREQIIDVVSKAEEMRGCVIGLNTRALNLDIRRGTHEPNLEVCLNVPEGLDISYISRIIPLGTIEKGILETYVTSD